MCEAALAFVPSQGNAFANRVHLLITSLTYLALPCRVRGGLRAAAGSVCSIKNDFNFREPQRVIMIACDTDSM